MDGSLSGYPGATLLPHQPGTSQGFYQTPGCAAHPAYGLACPQRYVNLELGGWDWAGGGQPTALTLMRANLSPGRVGASGLAAQRLPTLSGGQLAPKASRGGRYFNAAVGIGGVYLVSWGTAAGEAFLGRGGAHGACCGTRRAVLCRAMPMPLVVPVPVEAPQFTALRVQVCSPWRNHRRLFKSECALGGPAIWCESQFVNTLNPSLLEIYLLAAGCYQRVGRWESCLRPAHPCARCGQSTCTLGRPTPSAGPCAHTCVAGLQQHAQKKMVLLQDCRMRRRDGQFGSGFCNPDAGGRHGRRRQRRRQGVPR